MTLNIYGYAGCTTVKKACDWAQAQKLDLQYAHFNKVDDLDSHLDAWIKSAGMDRVFNQKAQTLKKMDEPARAAILASDSAKRAAMLADPRLIKRPIGTNGKTVLTGFDPAEWTSAFAR